VKGEGNEQDYGMRVYDPRLGRFLSVDPLTGEYPGLSSYIFAGNSPIKLIDVLGMGPGKPDDPNPFVYVFTHTDLAPTFGLNPLDYIFPTVTGRQNLNMLLDAVMPPVLGTMNGMLSNHSFGAYRRTAEQIGLNEKYAAAYDYATVTGSFAPGVDLVVGEGVPPASPGLALVSSNKLVQLTSFSLALLKMPAFLFAKGGKDANNLGKEAEKRVNADPPEQQHTYRGPLTGKSRKADKLTKKFLTEVKNVAYMYYSSQIKDALAYAEQIGREFILYLRDPKNISKQLKEEADNGRIIIKQIPKTKK